MEQRQHDEAAVPPGPAVWARWTWTTLAVTAPWLRTAPLGAPVVPLVYIW